MFSEVSSMFTQYLAPEPGARGFLSQVCAIFIIGLTTKMVIKLVNEGFGAAFNNNDVEPRLYIPHNDYVVDKHGDRYVIRGGGHGVYRRLVTQRGVVHYVRCDSLSCGPATCNTIRSPGIITRISPGSSSLDTEGRDSDSDSSSGSDSGSDSGSSSSGSDSGSDSGSSSPDTEESSSDSGSSSSFDTEDQHAAPKSMRGRY
jgi:hypothetical protein